MVELPRRGIGKWIRGYERRRGQGYQIAFSLVHMLQSPPQLQRDSVEWCNGWFVIGGVLLFVVCARHIGLRG